jgi:hypothetical protein
MTSCSVHFCCPTLTKNGICQQSLLILPNITVFLKLLQADGQQAVTSTWTEIEKLIETLPQFCVAM